MHIGWLAQFYFHLEVSQTFYLFSSRSHPTIFDFFIPPKNNYIIDYRSIIDTLDHDLPNSEQIE